MICSEIKNEPYFVAATKKNAIELYKKSNFISEEKDLINFELVNSKGKRIWKISMRLPNKMSILDLI